MILGWLKEKLEDFVKSHKKRRPRRKGAKTKNKKRAPRRGSGRSKKTPRRIIKSAVSRKTVPKKVGLRVKAIAPAAKVKITAPNLAPLKPPASLVAKKSAQTKPLGTKAGTITHFFTQIRVAVVQINKPLLTGEVVEVRRQGVILGREKIISMQINHIPIESAKKGEEVGMKISLVAKPGDEIFKL